MRTVGTVFGWPAELGIPFALGLLGLAYGFAGQRDQALKILARMEAMEKESYLPFLKKLAVRILPGLRLFRPLGKKYVAPMLKALVYLGLDQTDEALNCLEESYRRRDYFLSGLMQPTIYPNTLWAQSVQTHPRFRALAEKMNARRDE
jgi:hypothetical protein